MTGRLVDGILALATIVVTNLWAWVLGLRMRGAFDEPSEGMYEARWNLHP